MSEDKVMGRDMDNYYEWKKENIKRYEFTIHKINDEDVFKHLEKQPNKRAYLIELIRKDIKRGK